MTFADLESLSLKGAEDMGGDGLSRETKEINDDAILRGRKMEVRSKLRDVRDGKQPRMTRA